eukprot:11172568-Lingulodinium_polyedra.AAC.1
MGDKRDWIQALLSKFHGARRGRLWLKHLTRARYEAFVRQASQDLGLARLRVRPRLVRRSNASNDHFHDRRALRE